MILILRDDLVLETFDSPEYPPGWIEWIDVANDEFAFCSDVGQRYRGELVQPGGVLQTEKWRLVPEGDPAWEHVVALVDRAADVDPQRCRFPNLANLRQYLATLRP